MTQLTAQEILDILNAPPETSTSLQTLPGTDMIAVPTSSQPTEPQPSTSGQGQFPAGTPPLPIPLPSILKHAHDLLKKHKASKVKPHTEPTEEPSASRETGKKEEDVEYIVEDDDNDDVVDEDESQYVKKRCGKPVPVKLQNPKRFYCECGKSYTHASDLNRHKLEECGQTGRKHWVYPKCPKKFMRRQLCREHYYKVHKKKEPYKCEVCDKMFFHNPNYTEHKKTHPEHSFSKNVRDDGL